MINLKKIKYRIYMITISNMEDQNVHQIYVHHIPRENDDFFFIGDRPTGTECGKIEGKVSTTSRSAFLTKYLICIAPVTVATSNVGFLPNT
mmetsp:Transcript_1704/g.2227  ORF Transcript_1704/g.2227 Transcript_1704/m.2227 type:complete len:91 (-) Transcript_1704:2614-2886(-)